jgi:hypothetical protein
MKFIPLLAIAGLSVLSPSCASNGYGPFYAGGGRR